MGAINKLTEKVESFEKSYSEKVDSISKDLEKVKNAHSSDKKTVVAVVALIVGIGGYIWYLTLKDLNNGINERFRSSQEVLIKSIDERFKNQFPSNFTNSVTVQ